jgi:hypothetical protein
MTTETRQRTAIEAGLRAVRVAEGLAHLLEEALGGQLTPEDRARSVRALGLARSMLPMMAALLLDAARELPEPATGFSTWTATTGRPN